MTKNRIHIVLVDDPIQPLKNLVAVTIAGVANELGLPIEVKTGKYGYDDCIHTSWPEDAEPLIMEAKEKFRAALARRPLDILLRRKIMRLMFATTVEEP